MDKRFEPSSLNILIMTRSAAGIGVIFLEHEKYMLFAAISLVLLVWLDVLFCKIVKNKNWQKDSSAIQLEGFADFICFVIAPSIFALELSDSKILWPCVGIFILAGIWRIARFNVEGVKQGYYEGLPVTYNGYIFPVSAVVIYYSQIPAILIFVPCMFFLSILMVTRKLKIPEL